METVNITFKVRWRFKKYPHLKVINCKKIINTKTNNILKYHPRGFFIIDSYIKRSDLNELIELIPKKEYNPF